MALFNAYFRTPTRYVRIYFYGRFRRVYISTGRKEFTILLFTNVVFTDGITMVGFQRLGTVRGHKFGERPLPMVKDRNRSGSDPLHLYSSSSDENVGSPKYN